MFWTVFLLLLFTLTVLAATERSASPTRNQSHSEMNDNMDRDCAVSMACAQAFKNP